MSRIAVQNPVVHTPSFKEYQMPGWNLKALFEAKGVEILYGMLDRVYYYTDLEGWAKLLPDLVFNSSLYKEDRFDCENYAIKAMNTCAERYGLNTFAMVLGDTPLGFHGFNMVLVGDILFYDFMLFEPNQGFEWGGNLFPLGEEGYVPRKALV